MMMMFPVTPGLSTLCMRAGRVAAGLVAVAILAGCASQRSVSHLSEPMSESLAPLGAATTKLSQDAAAAMSELGAGLQRPAPTEPERTSEAVPDPLAGKLFSVSMQNAQVSQLLWVIADQYKLSLSVEPRVLELPQRANLYLKGVDGRRAIEQIAQMFDISIRLAPGGVLEVMRTEERVFDLELLVGSSTVEVHSGGDVFGAGAAQNSRTLQDFVSMKGELGTKGDAMESLKTSIEAILADDGGPSEKGLSRYALDPGIGSLYVRSTPAKLRAIEKALAERKLYRKAQIQIDAQLIDVSLNDGSQFGIDWNLLYGRMVGALGAAPVTADALNTVQGGTGFGARSLTFPAQTVGVTGSGGGLLLGSPVYSAAINALMRFGSVRLLSNPTLRMRNGVPAFLSVGTSYRYVQKITSSSQVTAGGSVSTVDVVTDSIFSGIVISVGARLKGDGSIELFVRPSQTEVDASTLALQDVGGGNRVSLPVVATKSMVTTLSLKDGDTVVMGGLISQQASGTDTGVPGLSDIPWLGRLFTKTARSQDARELVMVLKARVI